MIKKRLFIILLLILSCSKNNELSIINDTSSTIEIVIETKICSQQPIKETIIINHKLKKCVMDLAGVQLFFIEKKFYRYYKNNNNKGVLIDFSNWDLKLIQQSKHNFDTHFYEWQCLKQRNWTPEEFQIKINNKLIKTNKYIYKLSYKTWDEDGLIGNLFCNSYLKLGNNSIIGLKNKVLNTKNCYNKKEIKQGINKKEIFAYKGIPLRIDYFCDNNLIISQAMVEINKVKYNEEKFTVPKGIEFYDMSEKYKKIIETDVEVMQKYYKAIELKK